MSGDRWLVIEFSDGSRSARRTDATAPTQLEGEWPTFWGGFCREDERIRVGLATTRAGHGIDTGLNEIQWLGKRDASSGETDGAA